MIKILIKSCCVAEMVCTFILFVSAIWILLYFLMWHAGLGTLSTKHGKDTAKNVSQTHIKIAFTRAMGKTQCTRSP